jgi:hypothetical protein
MSFATGLITNTIPCWVISAKHRSPSSENVICLTTRRSRDLVLANHSMELLQFYYSCFTPCRLKGSVSTASSLLG